MTVLDLRAIRAGDTELVGGKASGLASLIDLGERVPEGFCLTTEAHRRGEVPAEEVLEAYRRLGGGAVAVRSSATAEDLEDASFAGQQDTYLSVAGEDQLLEAIRSCWESLHSERARAYREAVGIAHETAHMAVIVQRMVEAEVAGVLFTSNPLTGSRSQTVIDAAPGLGTAVVDGANHADHYVLGEGEPEQRGCLSPAQLNELRDTGARLQGKLGGPQDIEWAYDAEATLWLLQSRPITTLFPAPPQNEGAETRLYIEFGHVQGMLRPATPMGMSTLKSMVAGMLASFGLSVEIVDIGGRLYGDLTETMRDPAARGRLVKLMAVDFGPRAQAVVEHLLDDPRFAPQKSARRRSAAAMTMGPKAAAGILSALLRPGKARDRVFGEIERLRREPLSDPSEFEELIDLLERDSASSMQLGSIIWPVVSGLVVAAALPPLLKGLAADDEIRTVFGGMPHNVTIEMDLALWEIAQRAVPHRAQFLDTPPEVLAAAYRGGELPDIGLAEFLETYGVRSAAEVDVGVARWAEDPAPVFAAVANYLRVTDPEQAPDRRFGLAAARAERMVGELTRRARRRRPLRGQIAVFFLRRARQLAGLREAGKFAGLYTLRDRRRRLLVIGTELQARGLLDDAEDVMFLTLTELRTTVENGEDPRGLVVFRRGEYDRELRRRSVPVALLSDGTNAEMLLPTQSSDDSTLIGMAAAPGNVTGYARVVRDPANARIEPGEILVAPTTDPGWTPLFLTAGGLVTETGAVMAHGPTVAREFGIPAVICVPGATERIRNGQRVTVDGATGRITVEDG